MLFRTIVNSTKILFLYLLIQPPSPKIKIPQNSNVNELDNNFGGIKFGKDGDGNYGYYGADGSLIPFKSHNYLCLLLNNYASMRTDQFCFIHQNNNEHFIINRNSRSIEVICIKPISIKYVCYKQICVDSSGVTCNLYLNDTLIGQSKGEASCLISEGTISLKSGDIIKLELKGSDNGVTVTLGFSAWY